MRGGRQALASSSDEMSDNDLYSSKCISLKTNNPTNDSDIKACHQDFEPSSQFKGIAAFSVDCRQIPKHSLITAGDVESDVEESRENNSFSEDTNKHNATEFSEKKTKIKAKDIMINNKLEIQSENQRLERERNISLPYHIPKARSLKEFLSRKKKSSIQMKSLRSTSSNMVHFWKEIDSSIKEAADFFKSESEEEVDTPGIPATDSNKSFPPSDNSKSEKHETITSLDVIVQEKSNVVDTNVDSQKADAPECVLPSPATDAKIDLQSISSSPLELANCTMPENDTILDCASAELMQKSSKFTKHCDLSNFVKIRKPISSFLQYDPNKVPVLNMDDDFIDLDCCKPTQLTEGAKKLMARVLETRQQKSKTQSGVAAVFSELNDAGRMVKITTETSVITTATNGHCVEAKPGRQLQEFKQLIRKEIEAKWEEQHIKKVSEAASEDVCEEEAVVSDDVDEKESSNSETESEPDEDDVEVKDKPRKSCTFGNSEAEESSIEADDESSDNEGCEDDDEEGAGKQATGSTKVEADIRLKDSGEDLDCSLLPAFQPGGGLLLGGSTLTQQTQKLPNGLFSPTSSPAIDLTKTPKQQRNSQCQTRDVTPLNNITMQIDRQSPGPKKNLFGENETIEQSEDVDDPFMFVSGAFPDSTPSGLRETETPLSQLKLKEDSDNSEEEVQQGEPESDGESLHVSGSRVDNDGDLSVSRRKGKLLKYSDDEDEDTSVKNGAICPSKPEMDAEELVNSSSEEDETEADVNRVIDYDSEENEMPSAKGKDFLEEEAELSEEEWSGDEDEGGLDRLEAEAGDADILDEDQVASQLGRIHMRRLLDEDARDVRLIQEILFEDGDLHGDGKERDRKFRWKNLTGFDLANLRKEDGGSDAEDEDEALFAKLRHEKAQFLLQLQKEGKLCEVEEDPSQVASVAVGRDVIDTSVFKGRTATKTPNSRGSFLSKDNGFLSRIAKITNVASEGPLGPAHSRNFVFAAQEKQMTSAALSVVKEGGKRKAVVFNAAVKKCKLSLVSNLPSPLDELL